MRKYIFVKFYVVFLLLFIAAQLKSQTALPDSVFLTNGNIISGKIKNYIPNEFVKIQSGNKMYFFVSSDVLKVIIHSDFSNDVVLSEKNINYNPEIKENKSVDDIYFKPPNQDTVRTSPVNRSKYNDYIPVNLFFVQGSLEISSISSPFKVYGQAKFQSIYSRRFLPGYAFGAGACLRYIDFDSFAKVLFIDIRTIVPKPNSFNSVSLDPGIVFFDGSAGFNLNIAYNYAKRINGNLFLTIGLDLNYQSNRYRDYSTQNNFYYYISGQAGSKNPGITIGLVF